MAQARRNLSHRRCWRTIAQVDGWMHAPGGRSSP
jgi:hypothetical protein